MSAKPVVVIRGKEPGRMPTEVYKMLWGIVEGHSRLPDGSFIHTSRIKQRRIGSVVTRNTVYVLLPGEEGVVAK